MRENKNHVGRPTNEELRSKKRKKYTKLGLFLIPVLLITLILVNFNTKKVVGNVSFENITFKDLKSSENINFKTVFSKILPSKTVTMQSFKFSKDMNTLYITQHDSSDKSSLVILTKDNNTWKSDSKSLYYFGHVANVDIEYKTNGNSYLWLACGADTSNINDKDKLDKTYKLCRKNVKSLISNNKKSYGKYKKSGEFGSLVINNKDLKISSASFSNYQVAIDNETNKVIVRKGGREKSCYYIYKKSKFLKSNFSKEKSFCIDNSNNSNVSWQGFAFNDNYLYLLEGNSGKENTYLSLYNTSNIKNKENIKPTKSNTFDSNKYLYRKTIVSKSSKLGYLLAPNKFNGNPVAYEKWEPEGIQALDNKLLIGFTVKVKTTGTTTGDNNKCRNGDRDYCKRQIIYNVSIK